MAKQSCCGGASSCKDEKPDVQSAAGTASEQSAQTIPANSKCCCNGGGSGQESFCGSGSKTRERWVLDWIDTPSGKIPRVSARLTPRDRFGSLKCRWSIGRMDYRVDPGLYGLGNPDKDSPVLVTANYKMTFDRLRQELEGVNAWILVLDTDGVNVWCAAGKGTFGTEELVRKIASTDLKQIVSHRTVIVPQLGATGVAAHEVTRQSGFRVVFGPVRACDLKAFLAPGCAATEQMRTVTFPLRDRLALTPTEVVGAMKPMLLVFGVLFTLNAIGIGHYGRADFIALLGAVFAGCVVVPVLLPWIPGRAFSFKGLLTGLLGAAAFLAWQGFPGAPECGWLKAAAYLLIIPALTAFCAMNFTGSSTYTSLSGVDQEMRFALPAMLLAAVAGAALLLVNDFILVFG